MSASLVSALKIKARPAKPPRYPYSIEIKYAKILIKLVSEIEAIASEEIKQFAPDIIKQADITFLRGDAINSAFGWSALLNDMIERIALGITAALLTALNRVAEVATDMNNAHQKDFIRQAKEAYGRNTNLGGNNNNTVNSISASARRGLRGANPLAVNILNNEPTLPALLSAWEQNNIALIKSIPDSVVGQLRSEFSAAFVNGTNMKDLAQIVQDRTGVGKSRAALIARDQIGKLNGQLSEMRQKAAGIDSYIWRTVGDERVRPKHRVRNNKTYNWNDKNQIKPGEEIRCLTGNSIVDFSNGCNRLWRRWYTGELTSLFTENGFVFESTPNHPILTNRGWLPANELQLGDYVIYSISDGVVVPENNDSRCVARIKDAFESFARVGARSVTSGSKTDFHGDGIENEINVINFDRLLTLNDITKILHSGTEFNFSFSDNAFLSGGNFKQKLSSSSFSGGCNISRQMQSQFFFSGQISPTDFHGIASVPSGDISFSENSVDNQPFNTEFFSQAKNASAVDVKRNDFTFRQATNFVMGGSAVQSGAGIDTPSAEKLAEIARIAPQAGGGVFECASRTYKALRIVQKNSRIFIGHVYNLETNTGWYIADGVVTHNCRCVASPIFPDFE